MLTLSKLKPRVKKKAPKRVGRGPSSGHGGYSGRGIKGQKSRTGASVQPGFEGGRMPFIRQIPKSKGFRSIHPKNQIVALELLAKVFPDGGLITAKLLFEKGLIEDKNGPVKIVGEAKIQQKFVVRGIALSSKAKAAVEEAGK